VKIEGMPKERPVCANCRRPLKYWTSDTRERGNVGPVVRRVFERWRGYPFSAPIFDTLRCALDFAVVLHRAGYRRHQQ
jgi:hypothetical protein